MSDHLVIQHLIAMAFYQKRKSNSTDIFTDNFNKISYEIQFLIRSIQTNMDR